jgi:hypothetical protein
VSRNMVRRFYLGVGLLLTLAGCASPGDVAATRDAAIRKADQDYASGIDRAVEWNSHALGIPASGWVAILVSVGLVLVVTVGVVGWKWISSRHERDMTRLRRPRCETCGSEAALTPPQSRWENR